MKHIKIDRPSGHLLLKHQARKRSPPDWSAIQTDLLHEISSRVTDDVDYIRFRSVCSHWRSAAPKRPSIPWLVIEYKDDIRLNSPNSHFHRSPDLPKGTFIVGSCRGWLSLIDEVYRISIHNPITAAHVRLPVIADMPWMTHYSHPFEPMTAYWLLYRVLFSSDPMDDDCVFIGLACNKKDIIYCRAKDDCWTLIPTPYGHSDFIFYRGNCYAASGYTLLICDYQSQDTQFTIIPPSDPLFSDNNDHFSFSPMSIHLMSFLVVSSGDLYLVGIRCPHLRTLCQPPYCAHCEDFNCEVFRVDLLPGDESKPNLRLCKMQDLGGRAFFLGMKSMSVSVSPGDSPLCRPNCIYLLMAVSIPDEYEEERQFYFRDGFIDDNNREEIIVIFNMEDGSVSFRPVVFDDRLDATGLHWLTPSLRY